MSYDRPGFSQAFDAAEPAAQHCGAGVSSAEPFGVSAEHPPEIDARDVVWLTVVGLALMAIGILV